MGFKINKAGISLWFLTFTLFVSLFSAIPLPEQSRTVYADENLDDLCVIQTNDLGSNDNHETDGIFRIKIINRAVFEITYIGAGDCASPTGANQQYIIDDIKFQDAIGGKYYDRNTGDNTFNYARGDSNGDDNDESVLDEFSGDLGSKVGDAFGGNDKAVSASDLQGLLANIELVMGIEEDEVEQVTCTSQNGNFVFHNKNNDDKGPIWECFDSISAGLKGVKVYKDLQQGSLSNFNITYNVTDDGAIQHVSTSEQDTRTFVWCESRNQFRSEDCTGDLYIQATQAQIDALGTNTGTFDIKKDGSNQTVEVTVAGADSESAEATAAAITGSSNAVGEGEQQSCETSDLSWLLCPFLRFADSTFVFLDNKISDLLNTPDAYIANDGIAGTWGRLRNLAYIILIPVMLIMVISTALGFEFVSAYTVKKAFPRLFLATIFIAFSYQICQFLIIFTNMLGQGMYGLLTGLVSGGNDITLASIFNPGGAQDGVSIFLGTLGIAGIATIVSLGVLFSYALTAVLIIMIGYFLLALRQMIIVLLVLIAPLAILAWIFPNNDKLWKLWWGSFWKLLLMYPLIMMLLAAGRIFAYTVDQVPGNGLMEVGLILLGFVAPYLFIPATFKFAGGAFGTITGMVNDRGRGLFDRNKKYRGQKMGQNFQNTKEGRRFSENNPMSRRFNRVTGGLATGRKGAFGLGERGKTQQSLRRQAQEEQAMKENPLLQKFVQTDDDGSAMLGLSGGTNQGLREASTQLQNHWLKRDMESFRERTGRDMNETELLNARGAVANRAARAESAAKSVGVNRANAGAALVGVAQNKARALEGEGAIELVQEGARRMAGGNDQLKSATEQGFMYHARGNGRQDLGGASFEEAWGKQSIGAVVSGDTRSMDTFAAQIHEDFNSGDVTRMASAAVKMAELQGALPGATQGNADRINNLLERTAGYDPGRDVGLEDQLAEQINAHVGASGATQGTGVTGEDIYKSARKYSKDTTEAERMRYQQEEMARRIAGQNQP